MMKTNVVVLFIFFPIMLNAQKTFVVQGLLIDSNNQNSIDYANIGIEGKNLGTVSNDSGYFQLEIPDSLLLDSLTFSRIGYSKRKVAISKITIQKDIEFYLTPKSTELVEAKIVSNKLTKRIRGNKVRKSVIKLWNAFYANSDRLGMEVGNVIHMPNKTTFIKDFNFRITYVKIDSVKLRLNIYKYVNGKIGENLLASNLYFVVKKGDKGNYCIDLSDLRLSVDHDIFVTLENIAAYLSTNQNLKKDKNDKLICSMMFRGTMAGSKGYHRKTSIGKWQEWPATLSTCFWVTILK